MNNAPLLKLLNLEKKLFAFYEKSIRDFRVMTWVKTESTLPPESAALPLDRVPSRLRCYRNYGPKVMTLITYFHSLAGYDARSTQSPFPFLFLREAFNAARHISSVLIDAGKKVKHTFCTRWRTLQATTGGGAQAGADGEFGPTASSLAFGCPSRVSDLTQPLSGLLAPADWRLVNPPRSRAAYSFCPQETSSPEREVQPGISYAVTL